MPESIKEQIQRQTDEILDLADLKQDLEAMKGEITLHMLYKMLRKFESITDELLEAQAKSIGGKHFEEILERVLTRAIGNIQPPQIKVDSTVDLKEIARSIQDNNSVIAESLKQVGKADNLQNAELIGKLIETLSKNSQVVEGIDIKAELKEIATALNRKKTFVIGKIKHDIRQAIESVEIKEV